MKIKKRPVLIVIGNYQNGGIARRAAALANGFSDRGQEAFVIVTKNVAENAFFDLKEHTYIVDLEHSSCEIDFLKRTRKRCILAYTSLKLKLLKAFAEVIPLTCSFKKKIGYDVSKTRKTIALKRVFLNYENPLIIALGLDYAIDAYFASKNIRCSLVYGTRTYAEGELLNCDLDIIRPILRRMHCIVSQTEYTAEYFRNIGVPRIEVIGNPLKMAVLPHTGERNKTIVNFCRISSEKRLDLLINAFNKFHKVHPEYSVHIYGNVNSANEISCKKDLLNQIGDLNLQDSVFIHDAIKDIHKTIADASMFVSTSDFEGLSNSMIEALALGLPCICTDCDGGCARELIMHGVNGLLVAKNDEDALADAMLLFAENTVLANECGQNAIKIREKYDICSVIEQWNRIFDTYCH